MCVVTGEDRDGVDVWVVEDFIVILGRILETEFLPFMLSMESA